MQKKRLLSLLLALVMVFSLVTSSMAASEQQKGAPAADTKTQSLQEKKLSMTPSKDVTVLSQNGVDRTYDQQRFEYEEDEDVYVIVEMKTAPLNLDSLAAAKLSRNTKTVESLKLADAALKSAHKSVMNGVTAKNKSAKLLRSYTAVMNGFSAKVRLSDVVGLKADKNVKSVTVSMRYGLPSQPDDISSAGMIYAPNVWASGLMGDGMLVAIVDTGIDYTHELLSTVNSSAKITKEQMDARVASAVGLNATGNTYYKNEKVIFGYDYADADQDPMDIEGHGTHVAGISAANLSPEGVVMGVAYNAQLMAMKVFSDTDDGAYDHDIVAAVDDAVKLGADSINLSLGYPAGFTEYPGLSRFEYKRIFASAREVGAFVSTSTGNEGFMGPASFLSSIGGPELPYASNPDYGLAGSPGTDRSVVATGSVDNVIAYGAYFAVGNDKIIYSDNNPTPFNETFNGRTLDYVVIPGFGESADYEGLDVTGKVALIQRGNLDFVVKAANATAAGAIAAIVYDNRNDGTGLVNMVNDPANAPSIFISQADGAILVGAAVKQMVVDKNFLLATENPTGGLISDFSSYGITPDLRIKPDIVAPGGSIYSTVPGGYTSMGGTSMASPQVAGAAALIKQRVKRDFPALTPAEQTRMVENLLMSASLPIVDGDGYPYPVEAQGSGALDVEGAATAQAILYNTYDHKSKVELGDKLDYQNIQVTFNVQNLSGARQNYELSALAMHDYATGIDLGLPDKLILNTATTDYFNTSFSITAQGATFRNGVLTVNANTTATVTMKFAIPALIHQSQMTKFPNGYFIEGYFFLSPTDTNAYELSIPFLGFVGDWLDAPAFDPLSIYEGVNTAAELPFYWNNAAVSDFFIFLEYLGVNGYMPEGSDNVAPVDHVAISPNDDWFHDFFSPDLYLVRNLVKVWAEVTDGEGNLVKRLETDSTHFNKSFYSDSQGAVTDDLLAYAYDLEWYGDDLSGDIVDDGVYTYTMYGTLDYAGADAKPASWSMDVHVDTVLPTYDYTVRESEGKTYLDFNLADNHYLQFLQLDVGYDALDAIAFIGYDEYSKTYDVTDYLAGYDSLEEMLQDTLIYLEDYASNTVFEELIEAPPPPVVRIDSISFDSRIVCLVEGYAASIPVSVTGENLDGAYIRSAMYADLAHGYQQMCPAIELVDGKGVLHIDADVLTAGNYTVDAFLTGGASWVETPIVVVAKPENLWAPTVAFTGGNQASLIFGAKVSLTAKAAVTVNGASATAAVLGDLEIGVTGNFVADAPNKIVISGIKYPDLFPSYSFTFTAYTAIP